MDPQASVGDILDVTAYEPKGARPLGKLRFPTIPADALRSRLSGGEIVCRVAVTVEGRAQADCGNNPEDLPDFILRRTEEALEAAQWQPATGSDGQPAPGNTTVHLRWK